MKQTEEGTEDLREAIRTERTRRNVFNYDCPKCNYAGISTDLIMGWLCPCCKTDFFLAHERRTLINRAIIQTATRIMLLSGNVFLSQPLPRRDLAKDVIEQTVWRMEMLTGSFHERSA